MGTLTPPPLVGLDPATRVIGAPCVASQFWESWLLEEGIPRLTAKELIGKWQRLVVVAPHPDDEILACGALLHAHAAHGGACLVVAVTDGEASHAGSAGHDPQRMAQQRRLESDEGLQRLGAAASRTVRLGLPDGGLASCIDELETHLRGLIQASDVVVTTWRLDGHPDHEACGRCAASACQANGAKLLEAPVWMWHWADFWDPQVDWTRLQGVGMDSDTLARKLKALAAHRSQLVPRPPALPPVLDPAIVERAAWDTEYFFVP